MNKEQNNGKDDVLYLLQLGDQVILEQSLHLILTEAVSSEVLCHLRIGQEQDERKYLWFPFDDVRGEDERRSNDVVLQ